MPDDTTPPARATEGVRLWIRVATEMLPYVRAWNGWTVLSEHTDATMPGMHLVAVCDPGAPPQAAGRICEPLFQSVGGKRHELDEPRPWKTVMVGYSIPDSGSCGTAGDYRRVVVGFDGRRLSEHIVPQRRPGLA